MEAKQIESKISRLEQLHKELREIDLLNHEMYRVEKEVENEQEPDSLFGIAFNDSKYADAPRKFALNGVTPYSEVSLAVIILVRSATQKRRQEIEKIINEKHGGLNND